MNVTSDTLCHEGHKGPICDICEKGWAKDDGVCLKYISGLNQAY